MSNNDRGFISSFLDKYRSHPCLWQVTHEDYNVKYKRRAALNELLTFFKTVDEHANLDTVRRRITCIRNCFRKELNKVKAAEKIGKKHIPKLWYYNDMMFLEDFDTPRECNSVYVDNMKYEENSESSDDENQSVNALSERSVDVISPSSSHSIRSSSNRRKKHETKSMQPKLKKINEHFSHSPRQTYTAYGEHIAEKLRSMPPIMATYCQKVINEAIFLAETDNLDVTSHIVRDPINHSPNDLS